MITIISIITIITIITIISIITITTITIITTIITITVHGFQQLWLSRKPQPRWSRILELLQFYGAIFLVSILPQIDRRTMLVIT